MKTKQINSKTKIKLSSQLYASEVAGEAVVLEKSLGTYYSLNPMGTIIYRHLKNSEEPIDILELNRLILERYEIKQSDLEDIMQSFLQEMIDVNIVEIVK